MRKVISLFTLSAIVIALVFTGCKKGENDPFLTLKSRTARLTNDWKLSSEDYTTVQTGTWFGSDYTTTTLYSFDGTSEKQTITTSQGGSSTTSSNSYTYSLEISFEKDGTYKKTEINDGNATITEGNWIWMSKNKDKKLKNKEAIVMTVTKYTDKDGNVTTYDGKSNMADNIFVFDKLASDELVIALDYSSVDSNGYIYSMTGTQTFSKK